MKLKLKLLTTPAFLQAFDALCADPLSVKDRYALARSRRDLASHEETFRSQHLALVQRHGEPETEVLTRRIEATKPAEGATASVLHQRTKSRLEALVQNNVKSFAVDEANVEKLAAFQKELRELQEAEFDIFLDHPITLPADSKLTGIEIEQLLDLVVLADEPAKK